MLFLLKSKVQEIDNMKRLTKEQRSNIREILEDKSCAYCKHLYSLVDWWCGNKDAIKSRGTSLPGVIHCPYFELDKNYTRKELKKIKKQCNMKRWRKIAKIVNTIVCIVLLVFVMQKIYGVWSEYGPYTWLSFIFSLIIHGSVIGMGYLGINWLLDKILK
jgi:uncharacterized integral membrane protein